VTADLLTPGELEFCRLLPIRSLPLSNFSDRAVRQTTDDEIETSFAKLHQARLGLAGVKAILGVCVGRHPAEEIVQTSRPLRRHYRRCGWGQSQPMRSAPLSRHFGNDLKAGFTGWNGKTATRSHAPLNDNLISMIIARLPPEKTSGC
jgi:hypothetical protein